MSDARILLVEDSSDDQMLILRALEKHKLHDKVIVAHGGDEALECLFSVGAHEGLSQRSLAVVLLDINMPKSNGLHVLAKIRSDARTRHIPVVMFTSSREESDIVRSYSLGANSFLCKPFDANEFCDAVAQIAQYWLFLNKPPPISS